MTMTDETTVTEVAGEGTGEPVAELTLEQKVDAIYWFCNKAVEIVEAISQNPQAQGMLKSLGIEL